MATSSPATVSLAPAPVRTGLPEFVAIKPGSFLMGENDDDKFANGTERPRSLVRIPRPFALSQAPVSVGLFRHFDPPFAPDDDPRLPAVGVSWHDACRFCRWLSEHTGATLHLPSEAQWEFACRAGTLTPFSCGHDLTPDQANYAFDESGRRVGPMRRTVPGSYPPNPWNLFDMHGNVCEWTADVWSPTLHGLPPDGSPRLPLDPALISHLPTSHVSRLNSLGAPHTRTIRGGAWDYLPRLLRSSWRDGLDAMCRRDNVGFRLAQALDGDPP